MYQSNLKQPLNEELIKFHVPKQLKEQLQSLAVARNITLSALLRLVVTDYIKSRK